MGHDGIYVVAQEGSTPLFYAAAEGQLEVARELVRRGADLAHENKVLLAFAQLLPPACAADAIVVAKRAGPTAATTSDLLTCFILDPSMPRRATQWHNTCSIVLTAGYRRKLRPLATWLARSSGW